MTNQWNPWDPISDQPEMSPEDIERDLRLSKDFFATFSTESGKRVLEYWKKYTVDIPTWVPNLPHDQGHWREGQNSIVREAIARIKKAQEKKD